MTERIAPPESDNDVRVNQIQDAGTTPTTSTPPNHFGTLLAKKLEPVSDEVAGFSFIRVLTIVYLFLMPALGITADTLVETFANSPQSQIPIQAPAIWPTHIVIRVEKEHSDPELELVTVEVTRPVTVVVTATPSPTVTAQPTPGHEIDPNCRQDPLTPGTAYIVQPGDTLSCIALRSGRSVERLMEANPHIADKNTIYAGQRIHIPETE